MSLHVFVNDSQVRTWYIGSNFDEVKYSLVSEVKVQADGDELEHIRAITSITVDSYKISTFIGNEAKLICKVLYLLYLISKSIKCRHSNL